MNEPMPTSVPLDQVPLLPPDHVFHQEWATYCREAPKLIAEGLEGKTVLIKGEHVLGVFATHGDAIRAGVSQFLREPFFAKEISANEPLVRQRGVSWPWPSRLLR